MSVGNTLHSHGPRIAQLDSPNWLIQWLSYESTPIGKHLMILFTEKPDARSKVFESLKQTVREHYVAPEIMAKRLAELGAPQTAELLKEHLPTSKKARSGDIGEILATEIAECHLNYKVPVRRLRWKDGRNMALRGDDIVGVARDAKKEKLLFLKGESKSRATLTTAALNEAAKVLDRDRGRPTRHSVLFVAERLREQGEDGLAKELEEAVLQSFRGSPVEHLLFVLTGSNPMDLITNHLKGCAKNELRRHAIGVRVKDHGKFIGDLFGGL